MMSLESIEKVGIESEKSITPVIQYSIIPRLFNMSAQKTYNIRCPQCGHEQKVELYDSINVTQQPELKTALFENRLNRIQCVSCEASFRVDKPLLYHDPSRNILIHWMPDTAVSREEILDEFDKSMEELRAALPADIEPPRVRLVFTRA